MMDCTVNVVNDSGLEEIKTFTRVYVSAKAQKSPYETSFKFTRSIP